MIRIICHWNESESCQSTHCNSKPRLSSPSASGCWTESYRKRQGSAWSASSSPRFWYSATNLTTSPISSCKFLSNASPYWVFCWLLTLALNLACLRRLHSIFEVGRSPTWKMTTCLTWTLVDHLPLDLNPPSKTVSKEHLSPQKLCWVRW